MKNYRYSGVAFVVILGVVFCLNDALAQQCQGNNKISFATTDLSVKDSQWVFFGNTQEIVFAYDKNRIERLDSTGMRIWIREMPKREFYKQVRSQMMMDHRILKSSDNDSPPAFEYEGYEKYGFTITQEEIDGNGKKYKILNKTDYDVKGIVLTKAEISPEPPAWMVCTGAIAETALIESFYQTGLSHDNMNSTKVTSVAEQAKFH